MGHVMRAKMVVESVTKFTSGERIVMNAVSASGYPADGSDEDNTYAKFSPSARLEIMVTNPALLGAVQPGQKLYVDFSTAEG